MSDDAQLIRMAEALLFAAVEPLDEASIVARLPDGTDVKALLETLQERYAERGIVLRQVAGGWAFRTAPDLAFLMEREKTVQRRLSRAAVETLAIIAYHQPITRAEIEEVRGVSISKGTIDVLMEAGWVRLRGRKQTPGRPLTYGTTPEFLEHFDLSDIKDLPGIEELKAAGLLNPEPPEEMVREAEQQAAGSRGEKPEDDDDQDETDIEASDDTEDQSIEALDESDEEAEAAAEASGESPDEASDEEEDAETALEAADVDDEDTAADDIDEEAEDEDASFRPAAAAEATYGEVIPVTAKGAQDD